MITFESVLVPMRAKCVPENEICRVCDSPGAHWHYQGLTCSRCRVFFIRCTRLGKPFACKYKGTCRITAKSGMNCPACRLKKCLLIGMRMEDVGVARRNTKPVVRYFGESERSFIINNVLSSLTTFGPKLIDYLEGTKTATQFASVYVEYTKFIDCRDGPSPSSVPTNLDLSIFDLLLNPASCSSRSTAALDQMAVPSNDVVYQFDRSYGRVATSFADFIMSFREIHELSPSDKLKLVQYNFVDYSVAKAVFTKHEKEQNHEILMDLLSKQTIDGAPDSFMNDVNSRLFISAGKTVEKTLKESLVTEHEFHLLLSIAMFISPPTLSEEGLFITRRARRRLTAILGCYIEENYPQMSENDRRLRLRTILQSLAHFKQLAQIFGHGIITMATHDWGKMKGRLVTEFHLRHFE